MVIAKWKCSEVETLQLLYHAVIQLCQCLQGRLSFKCVWHGAITPLISFYPPPPLFVSVSLTFPSSFFAPQISSFVWKVTKQLRQIYAVLAVPPLFLLPSLFYLTRLSLLFPSLSLFNLPPCTNSCPLSCNASLFPWHLSCSWLPLESHIISRALSVLLPQTLTH